MEAQAQTATGAGTLARRPFGIEISARAALVGACLIALAVASFLAVAGAAAYHGGPLTRNHHPFVPGLRGVLGGLKLGLTRSEFAVAVSVITASYIGIVALAGSIGKRVAIGAIVLLHMLFLIAPPLLSSDIFNYLGYARLEIVHHLNAYYHPLMAAPTDVTFPYVGWPLNTTAYGPLFTLVSLPLAKIAWIPAIWLMKGAATLASLGCVALVWKSAERLGRDPTKAAIFFGLNPLLLLFGIGGGHNDMLMMLLALGGVYILLGDRPAGVVSIVAAAATKLSAGLLLPFAVLGARQKSKTLAWALGAGLALAVASIFVFGRHLMSISTVLGKDAGLATANNVPGFVLNDVLGLGLSKPTQGSIGLAVFVPVLILLLIRTWRGGDWLAAAGWATFVVLITTTWFLPWYIVWWLPIAALLSSSNQRIVALGLTVFVIALQMPLIA